MGPPVASACDTVLRVKSKAQGGSGERSPKMAAKALVQGLFEVTWSAVFWSAGRLLRCDAARWSSPGGQRVLVVATHPDDEVGGCAGVMLRHRQCGDRVSVGCVTDGRQSQALGLPPEQMARRRRREMEHAAETLGVELEWLGLEEGTWEEEAAARHLGELLSDLQPQLIYAPSCVDFHPEHARVSRLLAVVLAADPPVPAPTLRVYPGQVPLTSALCNLVAPVDLSDPRLRAGFAAHASQLGSLERCLRHRRYTGLRHELGGGAEEFWQMTPSAYVRLHHQSGESSTRSPFRGLRYYAFSDPLAYLRGRLQRRLLARRAGAPSVIP